MKLTEKEIIEVGANILLYIFLAITAKTETKEKRDFSKGELRNLLPRLSDNPDLAIQVYLYIKDGGENPTDSVCEYLDNIK